MNDFDAQPRFLQSVSNLEDAARIAGYDDLRAALLDALDLSREDVPRKPRLRHRVDPRAPAAEFGVLERDDLHSRQRLEDRLRCRADLLRVKEVAWLVVRDLAFQL